MIQFTDKFKINLKDWDNNQLNEPRVSCPSIEVRIEITFVRKKLVDSFISSYRRTYTGNRFDYMSKKRLSISVVEQAEFFLSGMS